MKVFIGSIIVVIFLIIGFWLLMSPTFKLVGSKAEKIKNKLEEEINRGERNTDQEEK